MNVFPISYARQAVKFIADFVGNYRNIKLWRLRSNLYKSNKNESGKFME